MGGANSTNRLDPASASNILSHSKNQITDIQILPGDEPLKSMVKIDDVQLAVASFSGVVTIWNTRKGTIVRELKSPDHKEDPSHVLSGILVLRLPNKQSIIVTAIGPYLTLWNADTGNRQHHTQGIEGENIVFICPLLQPENSFAVAGDNKFVLFLFLFFFFCDFILNLFFKVPFVFGMLILVLWILQL